MKWQQMSHAVGYSNFIGSGML